MNNITELINNYTGLSPEIQSKIIISLIFILSIWIIRNVMIKIVWKKTDNTKTRYKWRKTSTYIIIILYIIVLGNVWLNGFKSIATFLGLLSAGIAIALKDVMANIAGWIYIIARKPFVLGNRIEINGHIGDVVDIHIFRFVLLEVGNWVDAHQSTGRIIYIPNGKIFTHPTANFHSGFNYIWNELPVLVTFESNWEKAKNILTGIINNAIEPVDKVIENQIRAASKKYMIHFQVLTPTVYTSVKDSGVLLTIRYICKPRKKRSTEEVIWENILIEFSKCKDIDFAYPTQRFYNNITEGKYNS